MLRSIKIIGASDSDSFIGEDYESYIHIDSHDNESLLKHILFSNFTAHFQIHIPEVLYSFDKDSEKYQLFLKPNGEIQQLDYWMIRKWSKVELRQILNPQKIITNYLLYNYLGRLMPSWNWAFVKGTKDFWTWYPCLNSNAANEKKILKNWVSNFSHHEINETIENFFSLIDFKLNDIVVFTLASFMELWKDQPTLKDDWSNFLMDANRIKWLHKQMTLEIYQMHK